MVCVDVFLSKKFIYLCLPCVDLIDPGQSFLQLVFPLPFPGLFFLLLPVIKLSLADLRVIFFLFPAGRRRPAYRGSLLS